MQRRVRQPVALYTPIGPLAARPLPCCRALVSCAVRSSVAGPRHVRLPPLIRPAAPILLARGERVAHQPPQARYTRLRQNRDDLARAAVGMHAHVRRLGRRQFIYSLNRKLSVQTP